MKRKHIIALLFVILNPLSTNAVSIEDRKIICDAEYLGQSAEDLNKRKITIYDAINRYEQALKSCFSKNEVSFEEELFKVLLAQFYAYDHNEKECLKIVNTFKPANEVLKSINRSKEEGVEEKLNLFNHIRQFTINTNCHGSILE